MHNSHQIIGHVGSVDTSGNVGRISVATTEQIKKGEEWEPHTEWHTVVCFGKMLERAKKIQVGDLILCAGPHRVAKWKSQDGVEHKSHEIHMRELKMLKKKDRPN